MAKAPLPDQLPGEVFLLVWDRDRATFILHVDDENQSSFDLGPDVQYVMGVFKRWGHEKMGNSAIDIAKEFGAVKAHIPTGVTVPVFNRDADKGRVVTFEEDNRDAESDAVTRPYL